jgi:hypothetical protein
MSDFLLVVPEGWTEFAEINTQINEGAISNTELSYQLSQQAWDYVDSMLAGAGIDVAPKLTQNAKLIYTETGYRFWAVLN